MTEPSLEKKNIYIKVSISTLKSTQNETQCWSIVYIYTKLDKADSH